MEFAPWLTLLELRSELRLDSLPATAIGFFKFEPLTHCEQIVYSNHLATVEYHSSTLSLFHDFGQSQSKYFGHNHANTQSQSKIPKSFKRIEVVLSQLYLLG